MSRNNHSNDKIHPNSNGFSFRAALVVAVFQIILAMAANAQTTTFTYTGNAFTDIFIQSPSGICPITVSFTAANPAPPNYSGALTATSFSISDCLNTIKTTNQGVAIQTNAQEIIGWAAAVLENVDVRVTVVPEYCSGYPSCTMTANQLGLSTEYSGVLDSGYDEVLYEVPSGANELGVPDANFNTPGTWTCSPTCIATRSLTLTTKSQHPVPSLLTTQTKQPSVIEISARLTGAPDGQIDFSVVPKDLKSAAGHDHTATTGLLVGAFGSNTLVAAPTTTCMTQGGTCTKSFTVSEVSGTYNVEAKLDSDAQTNTTLPISVGFPPLTPLPAGNYYVPDGSFGQTGVTSQHKLNHNGTPTINANIGTVAKMYFNGSKTSGQRLGINDMSLPLGGLFDINNNWTKPHTLHRQGNSVDIDHSTYQGKTRPPLQNSFLSGLMADVGMKQEVSDPNIHYQISGTVAYVQKSLVGSLPTVPGVVAGVRATVSRSTPDLLTYSYRATNEPTSQANIAFFELDASSPPNGAKLSDKGVVQGQGSLVAYEADVLSRKGSTSAVPVGLTSPAGWAGTLTIDGFVNWLAETDEDFIRPSGGLGTFQVSSPGLPGIRRYVARPYIDPNSLNLVPPADEEDSLRYQIQFDSVQDAASSAGYTLGPTAPPAKFDGLQFLETIREYKNSAEKLGWIRDQNLLSPLEADIDGAELQLAIGNKVETSKRLQHLLTTLDDSSARIEPEADSLLRFNVEYMLQSLE
jgi:hypothetical protein